MGPGDHVHWYLTNRCNLSCAYCFKENSPKIPPNKELAEELVKNNVKKVTIGGGEPLLCENLEEILHILKRENTYVSLHTNGILLNKNKIKDLSELLDDIAIPIDSTKRRVQKVLRGKEFMNTFEKIPEISSEIKKQGLGLGYHTVFTSLNSSNIQNLYDNIKPFDYWRIYQFNEDLAMKNSIEENNKNKYKKITKLSDYGTPEKGYTDSLFAKFLLTEEELKEKENVEFVPIREKTNPYAFLDNSGDISFYSWFSTRERRKIGNIFEDGFPKIRKKLEDLKNKNWELDNKSEEEFINSSLNKPLWARFYDGQYFQKEIEKIDQEYIEDFLKLVGIYKERF